MDKINANHRPFLYYAFTALALPVLTSQMLGRWGFTQYSSGTLSYWHRPADVFASTVEQDGCSAIRMPPIVFIHGLGLNLLPYYYFIDELRKAASGRSMFLVSLP